MRPDFNRLIFKRYVYNIIKSEGEQMKSIYETKLYKLILSYYTNTKLHKNNVFSKMITFNVVEFDGTKYDYFITIMLDYNIINKTIKTTYIFQSDISDKKRSIVEKLKYDGVFIYNIYNLLFNDINSNNYISMKLS